MGMPHRAVNHPQPKAKPQRGLALVQHHGKRAAPLSYGHVNYTNMPEWNYVVYS